MLHKMLKKRENLLYGLLFVVVAVISLIPFFGVGFTTGDDIDFYLTTRGGIRDMMQAASWTAATQGRFYYLLTKYFYSVPYWVDNFYFTKVVQHGALLVAYCVFAYLTWKVMKSKALSATLLLLLIAFTPISCNHHLPFIAYPFFFAFSFTLLMCSVLMFIKYTEGGKYGWAIGSAVVAFVAMLFYEQYVVFLVLFWLYIAARNWRRAGKGVLKDRTFYREAMPLLLAVLTYVAIYAVYRISVTAGDDTNPYYGRGAAAGAFSLGHFFVLLYRCTELMLPTQIFFFQHSDMGVNTLLTGGSKDGLWFALTHAPAVTYLCAMIVAGLAVAFVKDVRLSLRNIWTGIGAALLLAFASHVLIAAVRKYNMDWYGWMKGYVTSYFAYFFLMLALLLLLIYVDKVARHRKAISTAVRCCLFLLVAGATIVTGYSNDNLSREWMRSQNRFAVLDELIHAKYFDALPENSLVCNGDLYWSTQWGKHITSVDVRTMDHYIEQKTGRRYCWAHSREELTALMHEHPEEKAYYMKAAETVKGCEYMLAISEIERHEDTAADAVRLVARRCDVFYYSPTKDYRLIYKDAASEWKLVNVVNENNNQRLTHVVLDSCAILPDSLLITNMQQIAHA